jgi:hypothetical protein
MFDVPFSSDEEDWRKLEKEKNCRSLIRNLTGLSPALELMLLLLTVKQEGVEGGWGWNSVSETPTHGMIFKPQLGYLT